VRRWARGWSLNQGQVRGSDNSRNTVTIVVASISSSVEIVSSTLTPGGIYVRRRLPLRLLPSDELIGITPVGIIIVPAEIVVTSFPFVEL
jgi:hypothetical protein